MKNNKLLMIGIIILITGAAAYVFRENLIRLFFAPRPSDVEIGVTQDDIDRGSAAITPLPDDEAPAAQIEIFAQDLNIPWEIAFLPDDSLLVTERPGTLVRVFPDNQEQIAIEGVEHVGEGGLLGLALDPDFPDTNRIYLYLTTQDDEGLINRVESYNYDLGNHQLSDRQVVIDNIPGARTHDGGRIAFGPDGLLYITTGDAEEPSLAQDIDSLAGKILRLNADGSISDDNPFESPVYSYGHRNPQGLAWDSQGRLWATEHGPTGRDEINLIEAGKNYGWPVIRGDEIEEGMLRPIIHSGIDDTWAPAGLEIIQDTLLFAGLRGSALFSAEIQGENVTNLRRNFPDEYGRLRVVRFDGGDWIYLATSNTDGRGTVRDNDDKIIRIRPAVLGL